MTTEDDFHRVIDEQPGDWQTLLVFSDWLRDRDDVRADGYAALAALRLVPGSETIRAGGRREWIGTWYRFSISPHAAKNETLPRDWFALVMPHNELPDWNPAYWTYWRSRRAARDGAARAFASLPAARRAELLAGALS